MRSPTSCVNWRIACTEQARHEPAETCMAVQPSSAARRRMGAAIVASAPDGLVLRCAQPVFASQRRRWLLHHLSAEYVRARARGSSRIELQPYQKTNSFSILAVTGTQHRLSSLGCIFAASVPMRSSVMACALSARSISRS